MTPKTVREHEEARWFSKLGLAPETAREQAPNVVAFVESQLEPLPDAAPHAADALEAAVPAGPSVGAALANVLALLHAEKSAEERRLGRSVVAWHRALRIPSVHEGKAGMVAFSRALLELRSELGRNRALGVIDEIDRALEVAVKVFAAQKRPVLSEKVLLDRAYQDRDALAAEEAAKTGVYQSYRRALPGLVDHALRTTDVDYRKRLRVLESLDRLGKSLARLRKCVRQLKQLRHLATRPLPSDDRKLGILRSRAHRMAHSVAPACAEAIAAFNAELPNSPIAKRVRALPGLPRLSQDPTGLERTADQALSEVLADAVFQGRQFPRSDRTAVAAWLGRLGEAVDEAMKVYTTECDVLESERRLDMEVFARRHLPGGHRSMPRKA